MAKNQIPMTRFLAPALLSLLALPTLAFGQAGDGRPVSPNPFVEVHIDEENSCARTGEARRASALDLCSDWAHSQFPAMKHATETAITEARLDCVNFYKQALRLQNTFCSYGLEVEKFEAASQARRAARDAGHQNVSQHAVAGDNRTLAGLNKKYMEHISKVGNEFSKAYADYRISIGKVNSHAGHDTLREAGCHRQLRPTNLDLHSPIPGFVLEALAVHSHAAAYTTYNYVFTYTRENYAKLKEVKEEAERNWYKAQANELNIPQQFEQSINRGGTGTQFNNALTPAEGAMYGAFQGLATDWIKKKFPKLPGPGASIIGGGAVIVWQWSDNKTIPVPETMATFIGMLNPYAGMAANILVGAYRTSEQNQKNYREFCKVELKKNGQLAAPELIILWGKAEAEKKQKPELAKLCEDSAKMAAACFVKRAQGLPAYSGDNCATPGSELQEVRARGQRIQAKRQQLKQRFNIEVN